MQAIAQKLCISDRPIIGKASMILDLEHSFTFLSARYLFTIFQINVPLREAFWLFQCGIRNAKFLRYSSLKFQIQVLDTLYYTLKKVEGFHN